MSDDHRPYALIPLVEVPVETIDRLLEKAFDGTGVWTLWLAERDYAGAPKKVPQKIGEGNRPPTRKDYESPLVGKKVEDAAAWLRDKPRDVDLNEHFFGVWDRGAAEKGEIVVCRIGGKELDGPTQLDCVRMDMLTGASSMRGGGLYWFDEALENRGRACMRY